MSGDYFQQAPERLSYHIKRDNFVLQCIKVAVLFEAPIYDHYKCIRKIGEIMRFSFTLYVSE